MTSMELRQAFAGLLTLSMFIMLGNMIKKDHFDYAVEDIEVQATEVSQQDSVTVTQENMATVSHLTKKPLKQNDKALKPCWNPPAPLKEEDQSKGFVIFSLTNGPEYHISQIADAVVVARYLGATLVLPDIKNSKSGNSMNLGDIYDVENVLDKLNGFVKVTKTLPPQVSTRSTPIVRVPNKVSQDYILNKIKPIYKAKGIVKIESFFPSTNTTISRNNNNLDSLSCQAMFGTLQLQKDIQEEAESIVQKLQTWSQESNGLFVAVDLRTEVLKKGCNGKDGKGRKQCYQGYEIGEFLKRVGFGQETVIYVTQTKWSPDLNSLRHMFPKTYTKENIMSATKKEKFLSSESIELEKAIDFYICSESDVFVPSVPGPFYENVAGMRIVSGKDQVIVPSEIVSPEASASEHMSPYVTKKNHIAYKCFC
ncbi:protein MANNAN SYNTHESIS-RELATED [Medicago truncatula]|uniref:O-fucosyltransferase family protein n=2 Tax=Medicago truncatula TaxID=3880 RepID=G7IGC0_MEDTR|nr:protein MANNAN SYNTHESIS-RELATED [Medicago truncatula]AES65358.1 GDP-fucose protein O-fucosyltransferase [Medicago truncatula]